MVKMLTKYLVGMEYHYFEDYERWEKGIMEDYEASTGIFIEAKTKEEAISWAENIAEKLFRIENPRETRNWKSFGHSCWVAEDLKNCGWAHYFDFLQNVKVGQYPDFENMGLAAYERWRGK